MDEKVKEEYEAKVRRYKRVFGTEDGKQILEDLAGFCYYNRTTYHPASPNDIYVAEGKRNVFLYVKSLIERKETYADRKSDIVRIGSPIPADPDGV